MNCLFCEKECTCINPVANQKDLRPRIEAKIRNLELNIKYDSYPDVATETKNPQSEIAKLKVRLEQLEAD